MLGLDRITRLLARLGDPHRHLPPTFHLAGTNGKGSTCAFLRAALEAAGHRVHVYTSPHLVRFNERIRLAGRLVGDDLLAATLDEVLGRADGIGPSFFEATTAAAVLLFARTPADAFVVEVGLGGRLDATHVLKAPVSTGIAALGLDHQQFLGTRLVDIATEKAGIAKAGAPLVTLSYPSPAMRRVERAAEAAGARWLPVGTAWDGEVGELGVAYEDARGTLALPFPRLPGRHQGMNAALAVAMLRHQDAVAVPDAALAAGVADATWPARLQRLGPGPLANRLGPDASLWLDGGHNPSAARAVAQAMRGAAGPAHFVLGLLANKDAAGVMAALAPVLSTLHAVPVPGHEHHAPEALVALGRELGLRGTAAPDTEAALDAAARDGAATVLIAGSLYLAGAVLAANGEAPD